MDLNKILSWNLQILSKLEQAFLDSIDHVNNTDIDKLKTELNNQNN